MKHLLTVKNVKKTYQSRFNGQPVVALRQIDFQVDEGEFIAIMGESGSGKSTLLNLIATLDKADHGLIQLQETDFATISEKASATFRRQHLGFVFQDFNLLDTFSVKDNILLPLVLDHFPISQMAARLEPLVEKLGIASEIEKYPYELSGGQKQRVAIARALITEPELLLADEPTGALDSRNSEQLLQLFQQLNQKSQTILMVTHSAFAASFASRVLFIRDGEVFHQLYRGDKERNAFFQTITETMTAVMGRR